MENEDVDVEDALSNDPEIPELFALLRQWDPAAQGAASKIIHAILQKGWDINDRDEVTDDSLLHYASKSGANGVGNDTAAASLVRELIRQGADVSARSKWTDMTPLHTASFFGCGEVIEALVTDGKADITATCSEFDAGSPLHLAVAGGSLVAVSTLIRLGANPHAKDLQHRTPLDCAKALFSSGTTDTDHSEWRKIMIELVNAAESTPDTSVPPQPKNQVEQQKPSQSTPLRGRPVAVRAAYDAAVIDAEAIEAQRPLVNTHTNLQVRAPLPTIGQRVNIKGSLGVVRFAGYTKFATGEWIGAELDTPTGKHNGTVGGVQYFHCTPRHGIFVPPEHLTIVEQEQNVGTKTPTKPSSIRTELQPQSPKTPRIVGGVVGKSSLSSKGKSSAIPVSSPTKPTPDTPKTPSTPVASTTVTLQASTGTGTPKTPSSKPTSSIPTRKTQNKDGLVVGDKLMVNGELATLRFVGETSFADGIWLGVEVQEGGKNNGTVEGVKYFTCADKHGLFVRPNKATRHGILCSTLIS